MYLIPLPASQRSLRPRTIPVPCVRARVPTRGDIAGDAVMHGFGQVDDAEERWKMGFEMVVRQTVLRLIHCF